MGFWRTEIGGLTFGMLLGLIAASTGIVISGVIMWLLGM